MSSHNTATEEISEDSLLLALGELIRQEISAGDLLREVVDIIAEILQADRGTLFLLDEQTRELVSVAAHLPEMEEIRVPLSQGVAGYVARTGQTVNVPFCESDVRFWGKVDQTTGYETRTMLAGPLHSSDDRLIGVVQVLNKKEGIFDEADENRLKILAAQAAALLEKTTLTPAISDADGSVDGEGINQIVGRGEVMREVIRDVQRVAPLDATVLLRGESGTGKGLFARALHHNSSRRQGPFVQIDCTTFPQGLMESELFGHERGAFTGAYSQKEGKVAVAQGGTLFLDEIGDLPPGLQGKLLTLLQERSFCRVGGTKRLKADIRIIAATNRRLEELIRQGKFREDLYYRLHVVQLELPPLRERGADDLRHLVEHFVRRAAHRHGRPVPGVRGDALEMLLGYRWPGNVRELQHCLESAVIFSDKEITPSTLSLPRADATRKVRALGADRSDDAAHPFDDRPSIRELESRYIAHLLALHNGNRSACARDLEIGRNTLLRKIREYDLE